MFIVCFYSWDFFFFIFASLLACWMFHLHFCCHFTLPSNAMRAVCVHTIHTHRAKCCSSACFVHSVEWFCSMVARVVALQCLLCSVVIYNTLFYVLFCKRWIFSSLLFTCVLITYSIRLILLYWWLVSRCFEIYWKINKVLCSCVTFFVAANSSSNGSKQYLQM